MAVSKGTVEVKGQTASEYIQGLIDKANRAKEKFMELNQEQVDGLYRPWPWQVLRSTCGWRNGG